MSLFKFYIRPGAKPIEVEAPDKDSAVGILDTELLSRQSPSRATDFKVVEVGVNDLATLRKNQKSEMDANIKQAKQNVMQEERNQQGFGTGLAKGALTAVAPYKSELYANNENPSIAQILTADAGDIANLASIGYANKITSAIKPMLGLGLGSTLLDVSQQQNAGTQSGLRTGLVAGLNLLPVAGQAIRQPLAKLTAQGLENTYLPSKAMQHNPNAPDFERGLSENLFSGFGKYSSLKKIEQKQKPFYDVLENARQSENLVDLEVARESALKQIDEEEALGMLTIDANNQRKRINEIFDIEREKFRKTVPAETHEEVFPNPEYLDERMANRVDMLNINNPRKAQYTKAMKKWEADPYAVYMQKPDYPELVPMAENKLPQWLNSTVVDKLAYEFFGMPIGTAMGKKSQAQSQAFKRSIQNIKGEPETQLFTSRGFLDAIAESSPEAREAMAQVAPYTALQKAIENRQIAGSSNSVLGLKDLLIAGAAGLGTGGIGIMPSLFASMAGRSPWGMHQFYNLGRNAKNIGIATQATGLRGIVDTENKGE